jgi:hypothetical protein
MMVIYGADDSRFGERNRYLSKAPGAVADYDGSGDWFKFHDWGEFSIFSPPPPLSPFLSF